MSKRNRDQITDVDVERLPPPGRRITLPTMRFAYGNRPVEYRDGRLYVAGQPVTRRREAW